MPAGIFALVLASAIAHAAWNFAARKLRGNLAAIWLGVWIAALFCAPLAPAVGALGSSASWPLAYIIASGILEALYFILLAKSYESGEISVVYPVARGTGVAGIALVSQSILGERLSMSGALGIF